MFYLKFEKKKRKQTKHPLHPITTDNANSSCITATAGTSISQSYLFLVII